MLVIRDLWLQGRKQETEEKEESMRISTESDDIWALISLNQGCQDDGSCCTSDMKHKLWHWYCICYNREYMCTKMLGSPNMSQRGTQLTSCGSSGGPGTSMLPCAYCMYIQYIHAYTHRYSTYIHKNNYTHTNNTYTQTRWKHTGTYTCTHTHTTSPIHTCIIIHTHK